MLLSAYCIFTVCSAKGGKMHLTSEFLKRGGQEGEDLKKKKVEMEESETSNCVNG